LCCFYYNLKLCSYKGKKDVFVCAYIFDYYLRANVGAQMSCAENECALMSGRKGRRASVVRAKVSMPVVGVIHMIFTKIRIYAYKNSLEKCYLFMYLYPVIWSHNVLTCSSIFYTVDAVFQQVCCYLMWAKILYWVVSDKRRFNQRPQVNLLVNNK
jgi:hypothetical protein